MSSNKKIVKEIVVYKKPNVPQKQNRSKKKNNNTRPKSNNPGKLTKGTHWTGVSCPLAQYITAPDVYGPCRIPRPGGVSKTGLSIDRSVYTMTGSATNQVQWIKVSPTFLTNCAQAGAVTNFNTAFGSGNNVACGNQFPSAINIDEVNIVAACMTVTYLSSPLNAAGEILIGTIADDSNSFSTATYNTLYFYPGFIKVPVSSLVDHPLRVFLTKNSPAADEFYAVGVGIADCMRPVICVNGIPTGALLNIEITRTWEYHTAVGISGDTIPYEISESGFTSDLGKMQDLNAKLATIPVAVEDAFSEYTRELALGTVGAMFSRAMPSLMQGAVGIGNMVRTGMNNRMRQRNFNLEL